MKNRLWRPALLAAWAVLLAGCAGFLPLSDASPAPSLPPASGTPAVTAAPSPKPLTAIPGGSVNLTMRPPVTLNPLLNADESVDAALKLVFEPLVKFDENFKPQPNIAVFEFAEDGMSAVLTLKSGVVWSDGAALTSADVDYTLTVLSQAPEDAIYAGNIKNIGSWAALSERSVRIDFLEPFGGQLYMFNFPVIPAHYYRDNPDADMEPLGNGIYRFESFTVRKEMLLVRNESYFGKSPYISTVRFVLTPDGDTALSSFEQGLVDALPADISDWGRFLGRFRGGYAAVDEYDTLYFDFIGFNFDNAYIKDRGVREAVCRCADADKILSDTYLNHARRALAPVNPLSWLYEDGVTVYPFDLDAAKALIDKANVGGTAAFRLLVNEENAERRRIAADLAGNLEKIGVRVDLQILPFDEYNERIEAKAFDMFVGGYRLSPVPDLSFMFASDARDGRGNIFSYKDDAMDWLLRQAYLAIGDDAYRKAVSAVQKRIASELPCVSLAFRKSALVSGQNVHGETRPSCFDIYGGIGDWFVER